MKTKELIRLLQEQDPSGEEECCCGNQDIFFVSKDFAYYDGSLQVLIRDPAKAPYYDVVGGKYVRTGFKIQIHTLGISDILDDPKAVIDYTEVGPDLQGAYATADETSREAYRKMHCDIERDLFVRWARGVADKLAGDISEVNGCARNFFDANLSPIDPFPVDLGAMLPDGTYRSYNDRRCAQWSREIELTFDGMGWDFKKKVL